MPEASYAEIRRAIRRFQWEDFLQNAGLEVTQRGDEVGGECPWCHWKRQSFYLNVEKGVFKCHYCSESGWAIDVVRQVLRLPTSEAIQRVLDARASIYETDPYEDDEVFLDDEPEEEPPPSITLPTPWFKLAGNDSFSARPYRKYAMTRMTEGQMERYGVGYSPSGRWADRIIVPVEYAGRIVTFVARAIYDDMTPKVDTPPGNEQYSYLFNLERVWGQKTVIITEGVFDALAVPEYSVATFGKKVTDEQVALLVTAGVKNLIIAWDADAQTEIYDTYLRLRYKFDKVQAIELPEGEDPSSLGHDDMVEMLETAAEPEPPIVTGGEVLDTGYERLKV